MCPTGEGQEYLEVISKRWDLSNKGGTKINIDNGEVMGSVQ